MIFNALINLLFFLIGGISSFLPVVTIASIPQIGPYLSSTLIWVVGTFNAILDTFPYGVVVWHMFFWILGFEALMLIAKFFLGHHLPAQLN